MNAPRLGKYLLATIAFFSLLQLLAVSAPAQIPITSCGTFVNRPGRYYLANDLTCHDFEVAITIESPNVELNLNDHKITGPGAASQASGGINVDNAARDTLILGPGVIRKMKVGVYINARGEAQVSRVTCTGNGIGMWIERSAIVMARGNTTSENDTGMWIFGSGGEFGGNTVNGNRYGVLIEGNGNHFDHTNVAENNRLTGIETRSGRGNVIDRNRAQFNGQYDLYEDHNTCENRWQNNTFGRANLSCIH